MPQTATSPLGDEARQRRADSWRESAEPASGVPLLSQRRRHFEIPAESVCHPHLLGRSALRLKQRRRAHQNTQRLRTRRRDLQSIQRIKEPRASRRIRVRLSGHGIRACPQVQPVSSLLFDFTHDDRRLIDVRCFRRLMTQLIRFEPNVLSTMLILPRVSRIA